MSLVFRRCLKANSGLVFVGNAVAPFPHTCFNRSFSDEKSINETQYSSSTIFIENGLNVHELPLVVRRLKHISEIDETLATEPPKSATDSLNYHMIQEEFKQCMDLRDVFSLLTKCTKITPNIALGAMERIYDLEKNPNPTLMSMANKTMQVNLAKGAILDKLIRVVMKTEDTQTILNILNTVSSFMELYKPKFSDEVLIRVIDNKLSIEQLCVFMEFLIKNKLEPKYSETIDKLWVGFFEREKDINEHNIGKVFQVVHGLKSSKKTILTLLEQKFSDLWFKININVMLDILETFVQEKYISAQSFVVVGTWLYANIHAIDQDSLLDIISKLTRLNYTDHQVETAVEKYMKLKGFKINSHVLIVGILNYCLHFKIRNELILKVCSGYFLMNSQNVPNIFFKSIIYPFGYLDFDPRQEFWALVETILNKDFEKFCTDDICSILLSFIYVEKYPLQLANRLFSSENLTKVNNPETVQKLHLIDTALSLECSKYNGPLLPKDQWTKAVPQDPRLRNIIKKTEDIFTSVAGGSHKLSTAVTVPHIYSDATYLIDVLIHPAGLVNNSFNWKSRSARNENIAVLIHLPDHFCSDYEHLVGHQAMRKKHLKILGMKVVSLKYTILSNFYTSCNTSGLRQYLEGSLNNAEECTNM